MILASDIGLTRCKNREETLKDWTSELPNEILIHVLSFLTLKEAARTSVLSKRWIDLWMHVARLDFDASSVLYKMAAIDDSSEHRSFRKNERCKYIEWVDKVLQSHKAPALDEFRVCFDLDKSSKDKIDKWLQEAFAKRVQKLELDLLMDNGSLCCCSKVYTFPYESLGLSSGNSSEKSHSGCFGIHPCTLIDFDSLRALSLKSVNVSGEVLEIFLHRCPCLVRLAVQGSEVLKSLEVSGPSLALQHLEISYCFKLKSIIVRDTSLVSLKITEAEALVLSNVPMLVYVYVGGRSRDLVRDAISWLSCCLSQLEILTICASLINGKPKLHELPQLTKLKQLIIVSQASKDVSLIGYTSLVPASPNLEKFVLKLYWEYDIVRGSRRTRKAASTPLQRLKVVELIGYYGRQTELELVHYFLENAVTLEKILIDPHDEWMEPQRWPRTSRDIEMEQDARVYAKEQLEGLIPTHVELVIR